MHRQGQGIVTSLGSGRRPAFCPWTLLLRRVGLGTALAASLSLTVALSGGTAHAQLTASRFTISIDGYVIGTFAELSGIVSEVEATEYWETSGDGVFYNKLPGKFKPPTITLKRGAGTNMEMWAWHEAVRLGQMATARKSASLTMFNSEGKPVAKYWLQNAWPSKIEMAGLKAGTSQALIEVVTLNCEYIQRVAP